MNGLSKQLARLTRASFTLKGSEPSVYLPGADTKNREPATLPLKPETAVELTTLLSGKPPTIRAFSMPPVAHLTEMLRDDLADPGIPYADGAGRVADFHSLRVTFTTLLAAAGVPVKTIQTLARHSTPVLTMNTYAKTLHRSEADAVKRLPDFSSSWGRALRATGTDQATPGQSEGPAATAGHTGGSGAPEGSWECTSVRDGEQTDTEGGRSQPTTDKGNCGASPGTAGHWARLDSNQRRRTPTGLQPVPFGHLGTRPCGGSSSVDDRPECRIRMRGGRVNP